jgi:hypothetical protein
MSFEEFLESLHESSTPPTLIPETLKALWYAKKGDWTRSHEIAQDILNPEGSWIHAYLHRVEGDSSNAQYWYSRAGKPFSKLSLEKEWEEIVRVLLKNT